MTIKIAAPLQGSSATDATDRSLSRAMLYGWSRRCPACGTGRLYGNYLKVVDSCATCKSELHHQRADDAPPYFTMLIVGHLLVGGALSLERALQPSVLLHMVLWIPLTILMSLWLLPRIKGALIGLQWAHRMHGFGEGPDPALPEAIGPAATPAGHERGHT